MTERTTKIATDGKNGGGHMAGIIYHGKFLKTGDIHFLCIMYFVLII
jgi:hypothetical protein